MLAAGSGEENLHEVMLEIFTATTAVNLISSLPFLLTHWVTLDKACNMLRPLFTH